MAKYRFTPEERVQRIDNFLAFWNGDWVTKRLLTFLKWVFISTWVAAILVPLAVYIYVEHIQK